MEQSSSQRSDPSSIDEGLENQQIHAVLIAILQRVVDICEASDIEYVLIGGGCLGIMRHQNGFVPWDDDLDIAVWAGDMPRLIEAMAALPPHLRLEASSEELNPTIKVVDCDTETWGGKSGEVDGIFVDILPMMHWRSLVWKKLDNLVGRIIWLSQPKKGPALQSFPLAGLHRFARWLRRRYLLAKFHRDDIACRRKSRGLISGATGRKWIGYFDHDVIFPLATAQFCGVEIKVPRDLHRFLSLRYGPDYMTLPDPSVRWRHFKGARKVSRP